MTLIEILVVLVLIGIVMGVLGGNFIGKGEKAKGDAAKIEIGQIGQTLDLYKLEIGRYPTTQEGLQALITAPAGVDKWNGPYWKNKAIPKDPWGNEYKYTSPGQHGAFDIISLGADGKEGGEGADKDISELVMRRTRHAADCASTSRARARRRGIHAARDPDRAVDHGARRGAGHARRFGSGVSNTELKGAARDIAAGLRLARSEAVSTRQETLVTLDIEGKNFTVAQGSAHARHAQGRRVQALHRAVRPRERQGGLDPLLPRRRQQRRPRHHRFRRAQVRSRRRLAHRPRRHPRLTMPRARPPSIAAARRRGFSLLEILVAFVILALVATALYGSFSGSLKNVSAADEWSRAALVAENRLAMAAMAVPLKEGGDRGSDDDGRITWETRIAPYVTPDTSPELAAASEMIPTRLMRVSVDVHFPGPNGERSLSLATVKLARKEIPQ